MKQIKLITLEHDCCAVCEYLSKHKLMGSYSCRAFCSDEDENNQNCRGCDYFDPKTYNRHCIREIYNPYATICSGDNFKRREIK